MVDVWPVSLPQNVLVDGYSEAAAKNKISSQPDVGPPIDRRRSTSAARPMTVSFELNRTQLATLRAFYDTTLMSGTLPFSFSAPSEAASYLLKFQDGGEPKWVGMGGNWFKVSMSFWVMPG